MFLFNRKKIINNPSLQTRVLVSPLDWGLGHATRCIPIIAALVQCKCEVFIAAEGPLYLLLKNEFPWLNYLPLKGYKVKFGRTRFSFTWKILSQFPKFLYTICYEKRWLKKTIQKYGINVVISDNRVGMYNKKIFSVYITHQLHIKTGNRLTSAIASRIHHYCINHFNECWVPDFEKSSLAGELSHPTHLIRRVKYIGALSRMEKNPGIKKEYDLLIILSGPEPQRTVFEELLINQLSNYDGNTLFIRGLPGDTVPVKSVKPSIKIFNHLPATKIADAIQQANIVISRSGYSTIMDLVKLGKSGILVATPGQAEQEYLAGYLKEKGIFFSSSQENFELIRTLKEFQEFKYSIPLFDMEMYKLPIRTVANFQKVIYS